MFISYVKTRLLRLFEDGLAVVLQLGNAFLDVVEGPMSLDLLRRIIVVFFVPAAGELKNIGFEPEGRAFSEQPWCFSMFPASSHFGVHLLLIFTVIHTETGQSTNKKWNAGTGLNLTFSESWSRGSNCTVVL